MMGSRLRHSVSRRQAPRQSACWSTVLRCCLRSNCWAPPRSSTARQARCKAVGLSPRLPCFWPAAWAGQAAVEGPERALCHQGRAGSKHRVGQHSPPVSALAARHAGAALLASGTTMPTIQAAVLHGIDDLRLQDWDIAGRQHAAAGAP